MWDARARWVSSASIVVTVPRKSWRANSRSAAVISVLFALAFREQKTAIDPGLDAKPIVEEA